MLCTGTHGRKKTNLFDPNDPELLESLKLPGGGGANGPPLLNLETIIPILKPMSHYRVNFKS